MQHSQPFSRLRPSSVVLALALLFALAGLYAVDRALSESSRTHVQVQVTESGALVQGFLSVHAEALQGLRGLYLDTSHAVVGEHFHSLAMSMSEYGTSFRRLWVTDSTGRITEMHLFGPSAPALPVGVDVDTAGAFELDVIAEAARRTGRTLVSVPRTLVTGEHGVILLEPIYLGGRFLGFAGGSVTSQAILESVTQGRPPVRGYLAVLAGIDTVVATKTPIPAGPGVYRASSTFRVPGGASWKVIILEQSNDRNVRLPLWGVGLATLGALIVMLLHERRQGERLAERSAELERLSTELLRANRAKSEFLANVSHELRTPLNAIVGFVELLRDGVYGELGERQVAPVARIASSANHLRQLVDQILDLAKMAAGRLEVHLEVVDLRPFVLNVASEIEALVSERLLNFSIAVSASLPRVRTDPMHLRQILMNLLSNAIKFTPSGGIAVRARLVRGGPSVARSAQGPGEGAGSGAGAGGATDGGRLWIALQVADSGIGIAPADQPRIFEEFEQVNAGPRGDSMQRGTGLGLAISRRLARLLGGDITLESELGKGSTFTVWLPVDPASVPEPTTVAPLSVATLGAPPLT